MKIYRAHTPKFHERIQNGSFVTDPTRKFNRTYEGAKNRGQLYFYAPTFEGAELYKGDDCEVYEFEVGQVNLLDLRVKENRALLTRTIEMFIEQDEATRQSMLKHIPSKFQNERMQRPTTVEDVINDNVLDGHSYWDQRATDFDFGIAMREQLEALGYDGIIFADGAQTDIALLNPARPVE